MRKFRYIFGLLLPGLLSACSAPIITIGAETATTSAPLIIEESETAADTPTRVATTVIALAPTPTQPPEPEPTSAPTAVSNSLATSLPRISKAPDITNETWLNSEPMTLAGQEGKVVLVEFWTYT